jgi:hypothetical protein
MNGWVQYLISLAWDVATLFHVGRLPTGLIRRLRSPAAFQGARYEIAIAAIFARLDCEIRVLDDEEELRDKKHVEFVATHRPTGQQIAVEAKSRHRAGILNEPGEPDGDAPLRADAQRVRRLFMRALKKMPESMPFMIFIDINVPVNAAGLQGAWQRDVQRWMSRMTPPTAETPDAYNALYVTNFSPQYDGEAISSRGEWLAVIPRLAQEPLNADLGGDLARALDGYGRVPALAEDGTLLD